MAAPAQANYLKDYRRPDYTITRVDLDFVLKGSDTRVTATSKFHRVNSAATSIALDGDNLVIETLTIDGKPHPYQIVDNKLLLTDLAKEFELKVVTLLDPATNLALEGLYMSDGAYCTQCEAQGFRRISYFIDRPDVLAIYSVKITADKQKFPYLLSNGNRVASGDLDGGRHFVRWEDPYPKPTYLFALVAGDFDRLDDRFISKSGREIALQIFVTKGSLNKTHHAMASLKKAMAWDEKRFDLEYDLDIYMIVAVDFFNMGAMENKGLNVFNTKYVLADKTSATDDDYHGVESVIGHEYFHNWTGNRVTCRDWFQLSLKEGLTVFRDQEFSADVGSRAVNRIHAIKVMKNQQFAEDSSPMAHPIRPESVMEMNNFYTVTVYNKGAEVIRMLHTLLGEQAFQIGMKCYFQRHDGQAVTCDDFVAAMEDTSGVDLGQFRRWYSQSGTPEVKVTEHYDAALRRYRLHIAQHTPVTTDQSTKLPLHIPFDIELIGDDGQSLLTQVLSVTESEQEFVFDNIAQQPIPSLLQNFSAPVKLIFDYDSASLVHILKFAGNEVAKWEASVALFSRAVWQNVTHLQAEQQLSVDDPLIEAIAALLKDENIDRALVAEILTFPSLKTLIEQVNSVDLDALIIAREFVIKRLSTACKQPLLDCYKKLEKINETGARALKNAALYLLIKADDGYQVLAESQYEHAKNMTDSIAALSALNDSQSSLRQKLLTDFQTRWMEVPLVMDKWFTLQATCNVENCSATLNKLAQHPAFSYSNPNRVRSLIGAFAARNIIGFHRKDGSGYRFLTEVIIKLNGTNPQVAAVILTPLIQFDKFDQERQVMMKASLTEIMNTPDLAIDLYEKISKAL